MRKLSVLAFILIISLCQIGCRSKRAVMTGPALEMTDTASVPPAPFELIARILDNLRSVHTARYNCVKKNFYGIDDTVNIGNKNYSFIECECPDDTFGVSMYVKNNPDGSFRYAYTMDFSYNRGDGDDFITKNDNRRAYMRFTEPPFFNRITRLCEYLLASDDVDKTIAIVDLGDEWQINATVRDYMQICFFGYPRVSTSDPYAESRFVVRVDKKTLLPTWTSYLEQWPQQRVEMSVSDVEINPYSPETFRVEDFFRGLPVYDDSDKIRAKSNANRAHETDSIKQLPLPTAPIRYATCDRTVSFPDLQGKVKVIQFTLQDCGSCRLSYPYLSKIYDELPKDKVEMFAVMYDHDGAQPEAYKSYQQRHGISYPMVHDNELYRHFDPWLIAPILVVIGGDDSYYLWELGFSAQQPEKYVTKVRTAIDRAIADLDNK
ncbi:MAG: TlpA family protein disulfide reductase [Bacteroides sp.]|nr:TlpA family protein disulfide reductase [Bacteroides sp.]